MVITLKPLELSVLERKSSIVGGFLRKDSTTYNYVMLLHIHHVAIQMISSKESRLVRRSRAVSWEESDVVSGKWRCKFLASSCLDKESLFAINGTVSSFVPFLRLRMPLTSTFGEFDSLRDVVDKTCGIWDKVSFTLQLIFSPGFLFSLTRSTVAFSCINDILTSSKGESLLRPMSVAGGNRDLNKWPLTGSDLSWTSISLPKVLFMLLSNSFPPEVATVFLRCLLFSLDLGEQRNFFPESPGLASSPLHWATWSVSDLSSLSRDTSPMFSSSCALMAVNWQHKP